MSGDDDAYRDNEQKQADISHEKSFLSMMEFHSLWGFFAQHLVKLVPKIFKDSEVTFREAGIHECVMACHVYASLARGCRFS